MRFGEINSVGDDYSVGESIAPGEYDVVDYISLFPDEA
jgi:hypothetical protein